MESCDSFETVKKLVLERRSVRKYIDKEIPAEELKEVLELAQRAPSSMNTQPYKVVVIRTADEKKRLAKHMLMSNGNYVKSASATLVVCCDLGIIRTVISLVEPTKDLHDLTELELANGVAPENAGNAEKCRIILYENCLTRMKDAFTGSYYKGEPNGVEGWSYKSAAFFMQQFVMLAQSKGWGTLYMGGFDSKSIRREFGIPSRYDVCCTIAVGYPDETEKYHEHPRFPPSMVIFENEFGEPSKTPINEVKQTYFWKSQ